ncbi:MAG: hypothetical protein II870_01340 [Synergistaceae bacterium]|nr:hypothetical protein [Synergistaceae bacterium]MBQ6908964.1 hypothetical protein [Synergistaceae bacterium]MBR0097040.1 hypothetical protein [Synergistaceae bacterium]
MVQSADISVDVTNAAVSSLNINQLVTVILVIGIIALIVVFCLFYFHSAKSGQALEKYFDAPVHASIFTLREVRDWIQKYSKLLDKGCKAIVYKVNNNTLNMFGSDFNVNFNFDVEKYLAIVIASKSADQIKYSVLINYDSLDQQLENALAPGNGVLVIEN